MKERSISTLLVDVKFIIGDKTGTICIITTNSCFPPVTQLSTLNHFPGLFIYVSKTV